MTRQRIALLPKEQLDERQRALVAPYAADYDQAHHVLRTLLRHTDLFEAWLPFAAQLMNSSSFTVRDRELAIMRTAVCIGSDYEWGQHVEMSQGALDDADHERLLAGAGAPGWTAGERALLLAVDELSQTRTLSDAAWSALGAHFSERQLIELPILVGHYHMLAMAISALRVEREPGVPGLP